MTIAKLILSKKNLMSIVFLIFFAAAAAKVIFCPVYEAETTIMIDNKKSPTSVESDKIGAAEMVSLIRIHSDLIQSDPILKSVVEKLKLYEDSAEYKKTASAAEREKLFRAAIKLLRDKYLTITSPPFTNLIKIKIKYKKLEKTALIANTLVEDYIKWSLDFQHQEVHSIARYLAKEVSAAEVKLKNSEAELESFRVENKISALPEEIKTHYQLILEDFRSVAQFNQAAELKLLEMEGVLSQERLKFHSQLIEAAETKLLELEVELGRLSELYTEQSPQIISLKVNIANVEQRLKELEDKAELETFLSVKNFAKNKKLMQEQGGKSALNKNYTDSLIDIPQKEKVLSQLKRQVSVNEETYFLLLKEQEKAKLAEVKETTENIKVISPALVPLKPSGRLTGLLMSAVVSFLFSLMLVSILELRKSIF